jgi:hypothetical protein
VFVLSSFPIVVASRVNQIKSDIETETINYDSEVSQGFISGSYGVSLWYVWLNISGTHVLFLAMYSAVYPSPINYFIGQHYFTGNDTEVFIGNRMLGFEIYEDVNGNLLLDAKYTDGFDRNSDETRYFFLLNASSSTNLVPPSKKTMDNVTHYNWGIDYKGAQGVILETSNQTGAYITDPETGELLPSFFKVLCSATLNFLNFTFDYWIENNMTYLKTGLEIGEFYEDTQYSGGMITTIFNNKSLSTLYATSVLSLKPYNIEIENSQGSSGQTTLVNASRIDIEGKEAFKLVFGETYTLNNEPVPYLTATGIYSMDSLPGDLVYDAKYFTKNVEDTFRKYLENTNLNGNASFSIKQSSLIYRECFPKWGNKTISYDPLYIAYVGQSYFPGPGKIGVLLPPTLLIVTLLLGIATLMIAVHRQTKLKGYKVNMPSSLLS